MPPVCMFSQGILDRWVVFYIVKCYCKRMNVGKSCSILSSIAAAHLLISLSVNASNLLSQAVWRWTSESNMAVLSAKLQQQQNAHSHLQAWKREENTQVQSAWVSQLRFASRHDNNSRLFSYANFRNIQFLLFRFQPCSLILPLPVVSASFKSIIFTPELESSFKGFVTLLVINKNIGTAVCFFGDGGGWFMHIAHTLSVKLLKQ